MSVHLGIPKAQETAIPAHEHVKSYQVGSYAVGNRLAEEDYRSLQPNPNHWNTLISGHCACQGYGKALGVRYVPDSAAAISGGDIVVASMTGCLEIFSTPYPESTWTFPWLHSLFGNTPTVVARVATGLTTKGKATRVVAQDGDGGTVDIDMGCLPGIFERNSDVLYICYNNQAYINTGVQRSGAIPLTARTTTTQPVGLNPGNRFGQGKDMARTIIAYEIPYVATVTVANFHDLEHKVKKAMSYCGAHYIHALVPCPLEWGTASSITVKLARFTTQTGLFFVFEAEGGEITSVTKVHCLAPVEEYLRLQRCFVYLFKDGGDAETLARLQAIADCNTRYYDLIDGENLDEDMRARVFSVLEGPEGRYERILHAASQTKRGRTETMTFAEAFESGGPTIQTHRPNTMARVSLRANALEQE